MIMWEEAAIVAVFSSSERRAVFLKSVTKFAREACFSMSERTVFQSFCSDWLSIATVVEGV